MGNYNNVLFILAVWFKCYDCQGSVSIQPSPVAKANEGDPLTLTCTYTGSNTPVTVKWNINNAATDMLVGISACNILGTPVSDYEVTRYSFTCSNPYTLKISQTSLADDGDVWTCTVGISGMSSPSVSQTKISIIPRSSCNLCPLILLIVLPISIFVILICCGCLDCCKCCRIFDHYGENESCNVTWYCVEKGCCSFFCCRPDMKKGKCFCGDKNGCCGGCNSCRINCACGWPDLCKSKKRISCGCCSYICCVQGMKDQGLDETSMAMTGSETKGDKQ